MIVKMVIISFKYLFLLNPSSKYWKVSWLGVILNSSNKIATKFISSLGGTGLRSRKLSWMSRWKYLSSMGINLVLKKSSNASGRESVRVNDLMKMLIIRSSGRIPNFINFKNNSEIFLYSLLLYNSSNNPEKYSKNWEIGPILFRISEISSSSAWEKY